MSTRWRSACDECGWVGTWAKTEGIADYGYRRHSCKTQRARVARKHRVARRRAASGPVRGCEHKIARHVHGTKAAYALDRCRCRACRDAVSAYERNRERQIMYGTWNAYVDAQPARDHLAALSAAGVGWKRSADLAGLSHSTVWKLLYGPPHRGPAKRCRQATRDAILAVQISEQALTAGANVDALGTRRRLQGLTALGYSIGEIARRMDGDRQALDAALAGAWQVRASTARAVRALYEQIGDQRFQPHDHRTKIAAARARNRALANRWPVPAAWDDDDLDDPYVEPPNATDPPRRGRAETIHVEDVEFLIDQGDDWQTLPTRLHVTRSAIEHACRRNGRRDLLERLNRTQDRAA